MDLGVIAMSSITTAPRASTIRVHKLPGDPGSDCDLGPPLAVIPTSDGAAFNFGPDSGMMCFASFEDYAFGPVLLVTDAGNSRVCFLDLLSGTTAKKALKHEVVDGPKWQPRGVAVCDSFIGVSASDAVHLFSKSSFGFAAKVILPPAFKSLRGLRFVSGSVDDGGLAAAKVYVACEDGVILVSKDGDTTTVDSSRRGVEHSEAMDVEQVGTLWYSSHGLLHHIHTGARRFDVDDKLEVSALALAPGIALFARAGKEVLAFW
jgi:hypothetical protein